MVAIGGWCGRLATPDGHVRYKSLADIGPRIGNVRLVPIPDNDRGDALNLTVT